MPTFSSSTPSLASSSTSPLAAPAELAQLERLQQLRAGQLTGVQRLDLCCGLTEFPREIFALADSLEILNLSGNALSSLPDDLHRLHKLRVLFCSDNRFTELPEALGRCEALTMVGFKANQIRSVPAAALPLALRWLILTDNQIEALPAELGRCTAMQKLMLSGNRLDHLPASLAGFHKLELLRIAANRFTALPDWLVALPRLAWLAYAGNPMGAAAAAPPMPLIDWHELHLETQVGEGASGVIHLGTWQRAQRNTAAIPVAIKLFKGAMTSDGLPQSEMAACIAAGAHPNLIGIKGYISAHPDGVAGLVMAPINAAFSNLAGPPSFDSCTRDVYAPGRRFSVTAALRLATDIADAVAHLHARGILHGDLYAHNILWNDPAQAELGEGQALLGDFGAASFFGKAADQGTAHGQALQRIEARAFGCLLEELLERCAAPPADQASGALMEAMTALMQRCLQPEVGARPLFGCILETLQQLSR